MCVVVYIAADQPLPLIEWDDQAPAFHVKELVERESAVRQRFGKPHVYYVGSRQGCGCGFQSEYPDMEDDETRAASAEDRAQLVTYLGSAFERSDSVELYSCWDGDWSYPPEHRSDLRPTDLFAGRTYFLDREFITVRNTRVGT